MGYGCLRFAARLRAGEAWAPGLRKVELVHEREGLLGAIYLDLHPRHASTSVRSIDYAALWAVTSLKNCWCPALLLQSTMRLLFAQADPLDLESQAGQVCARRALHAALRAVAESTSPVPHVAVAERCAGAQAQVDPLIPIHRPGKFAHAAHFTLRCGRALPGGGWQRPAVALVANMPADPQALLSLEQAETLWHEMGHALHSLLSRTHYQHLSGAPAVRGNLCVLMAKAFSGHQCNLFCRSRQGRC